jgi:tetratricopeptide (TPR) repeat protein
MRYLLLIWLCWSGFAAEAKKVYEFNSLCQQAYREITQLKLAKGKELIAKAKLQNPDNLIPVALENYIDFFTLFFNEDPADYKTFKENIGARIDLLKDGDKTSPFYRFCLGMVYLQRAGVSLKFGERWNAGWDFKRGYNYIKDNKKEFPTFTPNDLLYGPMQAMIGTVPKGYKWITNLFGLKGSIKKGMATTKAFAESSDPWARVLFNESAFLYCYLMFYVENKKDEVFHFIQQRKLDVVNNHLFAYLAVNLGINDKKTAYAEKILVNMNRSADYLQTAAWDYQLGMVKLHQLKTAEAAIHLEKFTKNFKGKSFLKDAYQKLSWCYYLQGNMQLAQKTRKELLSKAANDTDADKKAQKDAKSGIWPNVILLKARLLNDGGNNNDALALMKDKDVHSFRKTEEQLEFVYRMGRIYDDLEKNDEAIKYYQQTIAIGEKRYEYFASRAAVQLGQLYEKQGKKEMAITYYEKCLAMDDHEYKDAMDQRAKAGIGRCKGN